MRWQITNLDIDGTIPAQTSLFERVDKHVNLRAYEHDLRLWPNRAGLQAIRQSIKETFFLTDRQLCFYGTGDLNHISALLLENLPASSRPLTVVLFDNHPDWFNLPPRYHCGNWLSTALKFDWIESAILVGQDSCDLKGHNFWFSPFADLMSRRLSIYPYETEQAFVPLRRSPLGTNAVTRNSPWGCRLNFETITKLGVDGLARRLSKELAGKNVYIAIDKDVLDTSDAHTDWEQGRLKLPELLTLLQAIGDHANIIGADVCGERSPSPLKGLCKRFDAGRLLPQPAQDFKQASQVNERTNLAILNTLVNSTAPTPQVLEPACTYSR